MAYLLLEGTYVIECIVFMDNFTGGFRFTEEIYIRSFSDLVASDARTFDDDASFILAVFDIYSNFIFCCIFCFVIFL